MSLERNHPRDIFACRSCNIIVYKNWSRMTGIFSSSINSVNLAKMGLEGELV